MLTNILSCLLPTSQTESNLAAHFCSLLANQPGSFNTTGSSTTEKVRSHFVHILVSNGIVSATLEGQHNVHRNS